MSVPGALTNMAARLGDPPSGGLRLFGGGGLHPLLAEAELLLRASSYSGSGDWLDESGNGHDATLGSAVTFRDPDAEVLVEYPGLVSAASTTPDAADIDLTAGVVFLFDARLDESEFNGTIAGKATVADPAATDDSFALSRRASVDENYTLAFEWEASGGHNNFDSFDPLLDTYTEGERYERCVEFIADNGDGGKTLNLYSVGGTDATTPDGVGLTLIESVVMSGTTAIVPSDQPLRVGGDLDGAVARVRVYDSMGGSLLRDFYPARDGEDDDTSFTSAGPVGETWTLNGGALLAPVRAEFQCVTGNDGFLTIAHDAALDFDATAESFTVIAKATTADPDNGSFHAVVAKFAGASGWLLGHFATIGGTYAMLANGGNPAAFDTTTILADNTRAVLALRNDHTADELELFVNGTGTGSPADTSSVTDTSNATGVTIGGAVAVGGGQLARVEAVAVVRSRALTDTEILTAANLL